MFFEAKSAAQIAQNNIVVCVQYCEGYFHCYLEAAVHSIKINLFLPASKPDTPADVLYKKIRR